MASKTAMMAGVYLPLRPRSDLALLNALAGAELRRVAEADRRDRAVGERHPHRGDVRPERSQKPQAGALGVLGGGALALATPWLATHGMSVPQPLQSEVRATLLVVAGTRARMLLLLVVLGLVSIFGVLQAGLLKEYQVARLTGFLDPAADLQRTGYNLNQARIAVGSGQLVGKGLFTGSQTNLDFVPEVHTDFIFTAVGEELGFVGAATLLALFALLIWRGLRIAMLSKDMFGTLLAAGIVAIFAFQMFVNIGMTIGVSPITGIPLPFISYGGSSMITTWVLVGILLNVHMRRL